MVEMESVGKCYYCKKEYGIGGISRHLSTHLKTIEKEKMSKEKAFHVKVVSDRAYFLQLLIRDEIRLEKLDTFLREIWLECCGHLSSFEIKGVKKLFEIGLWPTDDEDYGVSLNTKVDDLFEKGMKLSYQYDFGSTTYLELTILNKYQITSEADILLLSRNEPLKILCEKCYKEPAELICSSGYEGDTMYCDSCKDNCTEDYDNDEVIIVNSPRMGVCGYEGGIIDVERDGVWKK